MYECETSPAKENGYINDYVNVYIKKPPSVKKKIPGDGINLFSVKF